MITEQTDIQQQILTDFKTLELQLNGEKASPVHAIRQKALENFTRLGFPTTKDEEWKYTNLAPILKHDFRQLITRPKETISKEDIEKHRINNLDAHLMVFINGFYAAELSTIDHEKVCICSITKPDDKECKDLIENHFAHYADYDKSGIVALNTAFAKDGAFIYIPDNVVLDKPVQLLFINSSTENLLIQPRNLFYLGKNSKTEVIEQHINAGTGKIFTNTVTEAVINQNAELSIYKPQVDSEETFLVDTTQAHQEKDSHFNCHTTILGGSLVRNDLNVHLNDENCTTNTYGLSFLKNKQHADNHLLLDHAKPNCFSNELYKNVLDDNSTGVFNGKILVRQDAQQTNAYQSNKNLLISDTATINTKPQLEIFADDVKCSHGATTGRLDKGAVYYLRSRGISKEKAEALLTHAFAGEILEKIQIEPLKAYLEEQIQQMLH